ncbi:MAG: HAD family hydrolase [Myxococcales bacterium]|nr:HAD family hydrolase [Myxococcales bacterium]
MAFDKLLVLDLDETLVHASPRLLTRRPDFCVGPYFVYRRPHVERFLESCLERFERVAVWTASTRDYALPVLDELVDVSRLCFVWARERCTFHVDHETREPEWLKDLRKLRRRGFDRRKVIFVDDTPRKLARSYGNLVTVREYVGDLDDDELPALAEYLQRLGDVEDVRPIEKRGWRRRGAPDPRDVD